ncbi:hypothetical protein [Azotobacter salinestris]|uniref:hypothetical protein n=1 Tax=Azotobacter salinestris TaxID=69964 RepID=UPI0032DE3A8F
MNKIFDRALAVDCGRKTLVLAGTALLVTFAAGTLIDILPSFWQAFTANWGNWQQEIPVALFWSCWGATFLAMTVLAWCCCLGTKLPSDSLAESTVIAGGFAATVAWFGGLVATGYAFDSLGSLSSYQLAAWFLLYVPFVGAIAGFVEAMIPEFGDMPFSWRAAVGTLIVGLIYVMFKLM